MLTDIEIAQQNKMEKFRLLLINVVLHLMI